MRKHPINVVAHDAASGKHIIYCMRRDTDVKLARALRSMLDAKGLRVVGRPDLCMQRFEPKAR